MITDDHVMILRILPHSHPICVRFINHYEVLGIPRTATKGDIKKAYLDKAKECHPDLNPENEEAAIKFQQIQAAHDVLLSSKQRAQYNHSLNQDQYYQSGSRRRSNVRSHGVDERGGVDDDQIPHRESARTPGPKRAYYYAQEKANLESSFLTQADVYAIILLLSFGFFGYVIVRMALSTKDELDTGRHNKTKTMAAHLAAAKRAISSGWGGINSNLSINERPSQPLEDTKKLVWDPDTGKLVQKASIKSETTADESSGKEELVESRPLRPSDVNLLKIEMSKKKSEYLAAKRQYNEMLAIFTKEQDERKKKTKEFDEFV